GPPYLATTAQIGGIPSLLPDVPISAALLGLFLAGAAANMTLFQRNRRRRYKFIFSVLVFGFCMARVVALSLRIAWACYPRNARLALAANVFTAAGVLILYVTNLVFAQRIFRAYHPLSGWKTSVTAAFWTLFGSAGIVLAMVVTVTVQAALTRDRYTKLIDRRVQLFCATYLAAYALLPVPLVMAAVVAPRRTRLDKFGQGPFRTKVVLLTAAAALLAAGATFRAVTAYLPARPLNDPAWYHARPCYYGFNFGVELVVVFTYALGRFDKRFHVPDGSSAPGHYSCQDFGPEAAAIAAAAAAAADIRRSINPDSSSRSEKSARVGAEASRRSSIVEGPSARNSLARDADLAWMARALVRMITITARIFVSRGLGNANGDGGAQQRELYGEDDDEWKHGWL
ncbi:hypothetical protein N656DRAFT_715049, partial [Canariomyces notabilis]